MIGTVDGTIRGLGVLLFFLPLTIPDPIIVIAGPMQGSEWMSRGRNRSCRRSVGGLLPRNLFLTVPIVSM